MQNSVFISVNELDLNVYIMKWMSFVTNCYENEFGWDFPVICHQMALNCHIYLSHLDAIWLSQFDITKGNAKHQCVLWSTVQTLTFHECWLDGRNIWLYLLVGVACAIVSIHITIIFFFWIFLFIAKSKLIVDHKQNNFVDLLVVCFSLIGLWIKAEKWCPTERIILVVMYDK